MTRSSRLAAPHWALSCTALLVGAMLAGCGGGGGAAAGPDGTAQALGGQGGQGQAGETAGAGAAAAGTQPAAGPTPPAHAAAQGPSSNPASDRPPPFNFEISTLSNRADLVSGGDALVEVKVPKNVPMHKVLLTLNGANVGAAFVADEAARTYRGLLTGLKPGANEFVADANGLGNQCRELKLDIHVTH